MDRLAEGPLEPHRDRDANAAAMVLRQRYAGPGEATLQDVRGRVAWSLAQAEAANLRDGWSRRFLRAMRAGFIPAGRILAAAGQATHATWVNCFVQALGGPPARGSLQAQQGNFPNQLPSLDEALSDTLATLRAGGGVGLDFSNQPDPVSALQAFDQACETATGQQPRPGAMMGVLRIDHPRIKSFIRAKGRGGLTHFNLSVAVTDAFMHRVEQADAAAVALWRDLAQAAWSCGEPGVLFIDTVRRDDSLADVETIMAVNPCGEQPLPADGSCCLGSVDLTRFVRHAFTPRAVVDREALARVVRTAVRMLDNVIDLSPWPRPAQGAEAHRTRRIGLGVTGLADALILLGLRYSRAEGRAAARSMVLAVRDAAVEASVALAREKGPFPAFDASRYLAPPGYASRLPPSLQNAIARHGMRNSHRLSLAPAGSISLAIAGGVSAGIEPVPGWRVQRLLRQAGGDSRPWVTIDPVWDRWRRRRRPDEALPAFFETADDITPTAALAMVAALAPLVDGGISKTLLLPDSTPPAAVQSLLQLAWKWGVKGVTVYRPNQVTPPVIAAAPTPATEVTDRHQRLDNPVPPLLDALQRSNEAQGPDSPAG